MSIQKQTIYKIICPISGDIKYIGKTENRLPVRLKMHISSSSISMRIWIAELNKTNHIPIIEEIETASKKTAAVREIYWINYYSKLGDLLNVVNNKNHHLKTDKTRALTLIPWKRRRVEII